MSKSMRREGIALWLYDLEAAPTREALDAWVDAIIAQLPPEFRASAMGSIFTDNTIALISVTYDRTEVEADQMRDTLETSGQWPNAELIERANYERLKAKFEGQQP